MPAPKSTVVNITKSKKACAHAKNKSGKRPLDMLIAPFEFGSLENDSLARMLVDSGTTVTKADATWVRVGSALSDLLCKAAGANSKDPRPMDVDMEVEKIDPSNFANDLKKALVAHKEELAEKNKDKPMPVSKKL